MKPSLVFLFVILSLFSTSLEKSQDYGRHIELSLLFYECQRSGKLPKDNRIFWRHDSMLDAGSDVGIDLTGGYYDAGDNVKYNFPGASAMTLLAWSGIEFADGYKAAGQWKYLLDAVKWGSDYFIKCHAAKDVLYIGVGNGQIDHGAWVQPEYINYAYPSFKVDAANPGSEVAAETAAALTATSILFKEEDPDYSATCLKHAKEIYDFADKYRGDYHKSEPTVQGFYTSYNGFLDELAWGAAWLLRATGEKEYLDKYNAIADAEYSEYDPRKYTGATGPISWDDKRPGAYILIALVTKDEKRMEEGYKYCDGIVGQKTTPGGLWYDTGLSMWASNRYAANAASMVAVFASILPESDPKRKVYVDFVKSQIDYILGDNPAGVNYVVGAEKNSPKSVHHRGASSTYDTQGVPEENVFTLYGALAGGPGSDDSYLDARNNYQMNEVALDYNAGFTVCLASLLHFGYGVKDTGAILDFDRAWPQKSPTPDISVEMDNKGLSISTGSGMLCSAWCVRFTAETPIQDIYGCTVIKKEHPDYIVCNHRSNGYLDGAGTPQTANFGVYEGEFVQPGKAEVLCNGFRAYDGPGDPAYIPEYGQLYEVTGKGGPSNTKPMFDMGKCMPSYIC